MKHLDRKTIDLLVPNHTILRYETKVVCSDDNRLGGIGYLARSFVAKEWKCKRCVLLDILEAEITGDDIPEISITINNIGNVH